MDSPSFPLSDETLLEHAAWVRKVARELVRDPGTADDLAQETWLAFLRARPDPDRPLRPWFRTTLRNALSLRARRRSAQTWREAEVARPESLPSSDELLVKAEEQHRLARLVLDLDEPYRTTMLLRYSEGLTPSQIAEARGVPASTVRSHIHRGLAALRERLDADHGGDRRAWVVAFQPWALRGETASSVSAAGAALSVVAALLVIWLGVAWARGDAGSERSHDVDRLSMAGDPRMSEPAALPGGARASRQAIAGATERVLTLVDERTRRPLAAYSVRVDNRLFSSDAAGQLRVPASTASLVPIDDPDLSVRSSVAHNRTVDHAIARSPVEIPEDGVVTLPAGPTYVLDMDWHVAAASSDLRVALVGDGPADPPVPQQVASIRGAGNGFNRHWLRFAEVPAGAEVEGAAWRLEARDSSGLIAGVAAVTSVLHEDSPVVHLDLVATGAIVGEIAGLAPPSANDVTVVLIRDAPDSSIAASVVAERDGRFALRWIEPGAYTLRVVSAGHADWSTRIEVHAGETHVASVVLDATHAAGAVSGVVKSETGEYSGQLLVYLLDAEGRLLNVEATTWRAAADGQALEAQFGFEGVPAGTVTVDVVSLQDLVTGHVMPGTFEAPNDGIEVTLRDQRPALDWRIDVLDEDSGEPLERFQLEVRIEGGPPRNFRREPGEGGQARWTLSVGGLRWNTFDGPTALRAIPVDAAISWSVTAEGFATAQGDETAFETDSSGERAAGILLIRDEPR